MKDEARKDEDTPAREAWETPKLTVEDIESATRGGAFGSHPAGDDAWYSS